MQTFTDYSGREWSIRFTAPRLAAIRKAHDVDLASWDAPPFERLAANPELLVDVLWASVDRTAHPTVDAATFAEALDGDTLDAACVALMEAVTDFFPASKRSLRRSLLEKTAAIERETAELALAKLDEPETRQGIRREIARRLDQRIASAQSSAPQSATSASESALSSPDATLSLRAFG